MRRRGAARRRRRSAASRLWRFWILLVFACGCAAAAAFWFVTWPELRPRSVTVSGNAIVPSAQILAAARIDPRENVWLQNVAAAERRVAAIPLIEGVWIHRELPASVRIVVTERRPFAVLDAGGNVAIVDRSLRVLSGLPQPAQAPISLVMPERVSEKPGSFVADKRAVELRDDAVQLAVAKVRAVRVALDANDSLTLTLRNGMEVLLGDDDDLARKIALIEPIVAQATQGRPVRAIDLRAPATPVLVYR